MSFLYLAALLTATSCMLLIDQKYKLAFFFAPRRTAIVLAIAVAAFIVWDAFGIALGIFFSGNSPYMSGLYLAPEFPVEELFFLCFLCYFTLVCYRFLEEKWQRISY